MRTCAVAAEDPRCAVAQSARHVESLLLLLCGLVLVPPVLLLDVRSDICTITEHVRKKLEALPYKVVEPHGATADKRFPKLLEHLQRGGKERAAVLSTAKTERRSPRGRGGESLPGFFYLTDRKLYYYGHQQGAPHMFE